MTGLPHQLRTIRIGDDAADWRAAGFHVDGHAVRVGNTTIELVGAGGDRGIIDAVVEGFDHEIDGMRFAADPAPHTTADDRASEPPTHENGVCDIDHLVAMSPAMDRTIDALRAQGLPPRRSRTFAAGDQTRRQAFFWLGDVILELAGDDVAEGPGPATLWGLAFTSTDLDRTARLLGDRLGTPKPAVQKDREIATLRTREFDISVPIVVMSPHVGTRE